MQFTDDEIETIKSIINEWGCDCTDTDSNKVQELRYKLGLDKRPTPEEIEAYKRRMKEWRDSLEGKEFVAIANMHNKYLEDIANDLIKQPEILYGTLRIKLPNDFKE